MNVFTEEEYFNAIILGEIIGAAACALGFIVAGGLLI